MVQSMTLSQPYDFALCTLYSRTIQLILLALEVFILHSQSNLMSNTQFLFSSILVFIIIFQMSTRWYYNIDGRYDLRQLISEQDYMVKLQYFLALFTPLIVGMLIFYFVWLPRGFCRNLFTLCTLGQIGSALGLLVLEVYEVYVKA